MLVDIEEDGVVSAAAPRGASSPERFELSSAELVRERDDRVGDGGRRGKQVGGSGNTSGKGGAFFSHKGSASGKAMFTGVIWS